MRDDACPTCQGLGILFKKVGPDSRLQFLCPKCGGSGELSDAVARTLSGQAEQAFDPMWEDSKELQTTLARIHNAGLVTNIKAKP